MNDDMVERAVTVFMWTAIYIIALNLLVAAGIGYFRWRK